jgi:endonuclease/exonuclease/phosphatase family metal-dependent hydrolase
MNEAVPARLSTPGSVRIVTWNLERPRARSVAKNQMLHQKLREIDADIYVLTETHEAIRPGLTYHGQATSVSAHNQWRYLNNPHTPGENCTTIWSRWPIVRHEETFDSTHAVCVEIATPVGPLMVYGTIITWHADRGADGTSRNWAEHHKSITAHATDWATMRGDIPLCVAGDFNTTLDGTYYGTREGRTLLNNALQAANLGCVTGSLPQTIDHICLSTRWARQVQQHFTWQAYTERGRPVSDHHGVGVDLDIPGDGHAHV